MARADRVRTGGEAGIDRGAKTLDELRCLKVPTNQNQKAPVAPTAGYASQINPQPVVVDGRTDGLCAVGALGLKAEHDWTRAIVVQRTH